MRKEQPEGIKALSDNRIRLRNEDNLRAARTLAAHSSPKLQNLTAVRLNDKTVILVRRGKDPRQSLRVYQDYERRKQANLRKQSQYL
jgi:hypothetical protein